MPIFVEIKLPGEAEYRKEFLQTLKYLQNKRLL